jgi:hypothetical protein
MIEAAGLSAQVRSDRTPAALIEQLASLVETDLPFSVAGLFNFPGGYPASPPEAVFGSLGGLLLAVDALAESGDAGQAVRLRSRMMIIFTRPRRSARCPGCGSAGGC